jgi:methionine-rich copper-binding protein CopC
MFKLKFLSLIAALAASVLWAGEASAHAFPEQDTPSAGAVLAQAPGTVSIRFDSELEPIFSKLIVKNAQDQQVSQGNGSVDPTNARVLATRLTNAAKGSYHVYWSVVSMDGHRTEGDYTFTVR